jgi:hypothetical protein
VFKKSMSILCHAPTIGKLEKLKSLTSPLAT